MQVVWADQPQPYIDPSIRAILRLSIKSVVSVGEDELDQEYDAAQPLNEELADNVIGYRNFTLSIRAESFEQEDGLTASQYVERVRDRMARRGAYAALNAVDCAFWDVASTTDLPTQSDSRAASVTVLDLNMRGRVSEIDPARYGYIDSVEISDRLGLPIRFANVGNNGAAIPMGIP
jgi:hypothetical protein